MMLSACVRAESRVSRLFQALPFHPGFKHHGIAVPVTSGSCSRLFSTSPAAFKMRLPSALDLFRKERNGEVREKYPGAPQGKIWTELTRDWHAADQETKDRYFEQEKFYETTSAGLRLNTSITPREIFVRAEMKQRPEDVSKSSYETVLNEKWNQLTAVEKAPYLIISRQKRRAERKQQELAGRTKKLSGYILFMKENLRPIIDQSPAEKVSDLFKKCVAEWKSLSDDAKREYQDRASQMAQESDNNNPVKDSRKSGPRSTYNLFIQQNMPNRPKDMHANDYMSELARRWKEMSVDEKRNYGARLDEHGNVLETESDRRVSNARPLKKKVADGAEVSEAKTTKRTAKSDATAPKKKVTKKTVSRKAEPKKKAGRPEKKTAEPEKKSAESSAT